jgi:hypothetical protein
MLNPHIYYLNTLFDLEIGALDSSGLRRSAAEMSVLAIPFAKQNDYALLDIEIEDNYLDYLKACGLEIPSIIYGKSKCIDECSGVVWGWSEQAIERIKGSGAVCECPSIDVIKKVNSRKFCNKLGRQYGLGVPGSTYLESNQDFHEKSALLQDFPLVIKPAYGGSGHGFTMLNSKDDIPKADIGKGAVIEPWMTRVCDLSTAVTIDKCGQLVKMRHQRLFCNSHGAFFGIYLSKTDAEIDKWREPMEKAAIPVSSALYKEGYYGPAGFDAFVYEEKSGVHLAPVIEINARHVMSDIADALRVQLAPENHVFFRFVSRRNMRVPSSYEEWLTRMGSDVYNPDTKQGIICVSPFKGRIDGRWLFLSRYAFFLSAASESELFAMDERLRNKLKGTD